MSALSSKPALAGSRAPRAWRVGAWALLGAILALSFWAYLSPDMQLQWETLAALCGF